jgi:hypothetical protein
MVLALVMVAATLQERPPDPVCHADVRWAADGAQAVSRATSGARSFSLFTVVGRPRVDDCAGEIRLTVAYFDGANDLLCAGTIGAVATHRDGAQITHLELRPMNLTEFVRWRNGARLPLRAMPLACTNADSTAELQQGELDRAAYLRVYATLLTRYGGLATAELRLQIQP